MSKFGELLDEKKPLLIVFFSEFDELSTSMHPVLKDVAAAIGDKVQIRLTGNLTLANDSRYHFITIMQIQDKVVSILP